MLRISSFFLLLVLISYANLSISSQEGRHIGKKVSIIEFYGLQSRKASDLYQVITTRYKKPLSKFWLFSLLYEVKNNHYLLIQRMQ